MHISNTRNRSKGGATPAGRLRSSTVHRVQPEGDEDLGLNVRLHWPGRDGPSDPGSQGAGSGPRHRADEPGEPEKPDRWEPFPRRSGDRVGPGQDEPAETRPGGERGGPPPERSEPPAGGGERQEAEEAGEAGEGAPRGDDRPSPWQEVVSPWQETPAPSEEARAPEPPTTALVMLREESIQGALGAMAVRVEGLAGATATFRRLMMDRLADYTGQVVGMVQASAGHLEEYRSVQERALSELRREAAASRESLRALAADTREVLRAARDATGQEAGSAETQVGRDRMEELGRMVAGELERTGERIDQVVSSVTGVLDGPLQEQREWLEARLPALAATLESALGEGLAELRQELPAAVAAEVGPMLEEAVAGAVAGRSKAPPMLEQRLARTVAERVEAALWTALSSAQDDLEDRLPGAVADRLAGAIEGALSQARRTIGDSLGEVGPGPAGWEEGPQPDQETPTVASELTSLMAKTLEEQREDLEGRLDALADRLGEGTSATQETVAELAREVGALRRRIPLRAGRTEAAAQARVIAEEVVALLSDGEHRAPIPPASARSEEPDGGPEPAARPGRPLRPRPPRR